MSKCPFHVNHAATANEKLFPTALNLRSLQQFGANDPTPDDFDYRKEFLALDLAAVKKDLLQLMTTSQDWWPADYGHYGGLMIRLAWHAAGTYRSFDGRGGTNAANQRFAPLNSWPDNGNLDKARRLLWPIKQKYGRKLSWADLIALAGNVALESMGFKTYGYGGGRVDVYAPEYDVYWGKEMEMLTDKRHDSTTGRLEDPHANVVQGLIYVNPEGTADSVPDPLKAAKDIRETFGKMGMDDYETAALVAGGHTFGKSHGMYPDSDLGPGPEGSDIASQNLGYHAPDGHKGMAEDTCTSGIEGSWTQNPTQWNMEYVENLFRYKWEKLQGPGGKWQWKPMDSDADKTPDAHVQGQKNDLMMMTTDLSLVEDPDYRKIMEHFRGNPQEFAQAFAKAWYKLLHRDSGPVDRLLGPEVPSKAELWQDPIPKVDHPLIGETEVAELKKRILETDNSWSSYFRGSRGKSSISIAQLIKVAWGSASTFRRTDFRGGANGARICLEPQRKWAVNSPSELDDVLAYLTKIQNDFHNGRSDGMKVSMADLIVLAGVAALERAISEAGFKNITVPFTPGRMDASQDMTDVEGQQVLEPKSDAFRNFYSPDSTGRLPEEMMVDRANLLGLTAPEMAVLLGGMRSLGAVSGAAGLGVLTSKPGTLSNDFFVNLLDMSTKWSPIDDSEDVFVGTDRQTGQTKWHASRVDLIFGSNSELRAIAEYYATQDAKESFMKDFVATWTKCMEADRYDLHH